MDNGKSTLDNFYQEVKQKFLVLVLFGHNVREGEECDFLEFSVLRGWSNDLAFRTTQSLMLGNESASHNHQECSIFMLLCHEDTWGYFRTYPKICPPFSPVECIPGNDRSSIKLCHDVANTPQSLWSAISISMETSNAIRFQFATSLFVWHGVKWEDVGTWIGVQYRVGIPIIMWPDVDLVGRPCCYFQCSKQHRILASPTTTYNICTP